VAFLVLVGYPHRIPRRFNAISTACFLHAGDSPGGKIDPLGRVWRRCRYWKNPGLGGLARQREAGRRFADPHAGDTVAIVGAFAHSCEQANQNAVPPSARGGGRWGLGGVARRWMGVMAHYVPPPPAPSRKGRGSSLWLSGNSPSPCGGGGGRGPRSRRHRPFAAARRAGRRLGAVDPPATPRRLPPSTIAPNTRSTCASGLTWHRSTPAAPSRSRRARVRSRIRWSVDRGSVTLSSAREHRRDGAPSRSLIAAVAPRECRQRAPCSSVPPLLVAQPAAVKS